MALTPTQKSFVDLLRESVRLQDPNIEVDPAYKYTDDELWRVLSLLTPSHDSRYIADTLPDSEKYFVLLLAKKEIFSRLASSMAPFYPLSAEGASLQKNVRFDHYMALVGQVSQEYESFMRLRMEFNSQVKSYDMYTERYHFTQRNYALAKNPSVLLTTSVVTQNSVNLDWSEFDENAGLFNFYKVYVGTSPIVDPYADNPIDPNLKAQWLTTDIHRTKYRITGLNPGTTYYIAVITMDRNGLYGYAEEQITTLLAG